MTSLEARWVGILLKFGTLVLPLVAAIATLVFFADMREQPRQMAAKITLQEAPSRAR